MTNSKHRDIIDEVNNKPIVQITDTTISKVPKLKIDGLTDEQNIFVQEQHRELLRYARDKNESKEVAFVFRKDFSDRYLFLGSDSEINFGAGLSGKGDNLFVMHNHPRNSGYSDTDIVTFIRNDNIKHLSIIKNNGEIEIISKLNHFSKERMITEFKRQLKKYVKTGSDEEIDKAINKLLEKSKGDLSWTKSK